MILQKGSTEIRNLFSGIIWISFAFTALFVCILCLVKGMNLVNVDLTYFVLLLCGVGAVLTGWNNTQNALFTKFKLFKQMSTAFVLASVFSVIFQAIFYFVGWIGNGLIYGWLVGLVISFVYNARVSKGRLGKVDIPLLKQSVREHFGIVKYTYPSDSINVLANNILPILTVMYFTKAEIGIYAMAFKILSTPLVLLSGSVSRVYFQKAVSLNNSNKKALLDLTYRIIFSNVVIILAFVLFINTVGIYLLDLFLHSSWEGIGSYILALSFWILARSAMNPIASIVVVLNKNKFSLIFNIYLLLVNFIGLYFGVLKNDFLYCIWIFSILSGIGYLVLLFVVLFNLKKNVKV